MLNNICASALKETLCFKKESKAPQQRLNEPRDQTVVCHLPYSCEIIFTATHVSVMVYCIIVSLCTCSTLFLPQEGTVLLVTLLPDCRVQRSRGPDK